MMCYRCVSDLFGPDAACFSSAREAERALSELAGVPVRLTEIEKDKWAIAWHPGFYIEPGRTTPVYNFEPEFDREAWLQNPSWELVLVKEET